MTAEPESHRLGLLPGARLLLHGFRARRARARGDRSGYLRQLSAALAIAVSERHAPALHASLDDGIAALEPVAGSRGGFFSCILVTRRARYFAKCVAARSHEAAFWRAWRQGAIRGQGAHYTILPPRITVLAGEATLLLFPALDLPTLDPSASRRTRRAAYRRNAIGVARAIADFNSEHLAPLPLRTSRGCAPLPVPRPGAVMGALGVEAAEARALAATLRRVEAGWGAFAEALYDGPRCLCHMDLGPGNVALGNDLRNGGGGGRCLLFDFGHAAMAPIGADLHTLRRYAGRRGGGGGTDEAALAAYGEVFAAKGIALDPDAVRRARDAHFAARYRNLALPSARREGAFAAALATSLALLGLPGEPAAGGTARGARRARRDRP